MENKKYFYAKLKNKDIVYVDAKKGFLVIEDIDCFYNYTINFKRLTRIDNSLGIWFEANESHEVYNITEKKKELITEEDFKDQFSNAFVFFER